MAEHHVATMRIAIKAPAIVQNIVSPRADRSLNVNRAEVGRPYGWRDWKTSPHELTMSLLSTATIF